MSLRRELLLSFGVQGAGAISVLAATLVLGATFGPEVQGAFNRTKSEIEFLAAFAMFGLPQALFFHVKSGLLKMSSALQWAWRSAFLALVIGCVCALAAFAKTQILLSVLFGMAVAANVMHGQLRALLLVHEHAGWFNLFTALPQVLLFLGVISVLGAGSLMRLTTSVWITLFALAYGLAAMFAWQRLNIASKSFSGFSVGWRGLGRYGMAMWLVAALSTASILTNQQWIEAREGSAALGRFTMAMTLAQIPLTPISYAAPILWRHWMERPGARAARHGASLLFVVLLGMAVVIGVLGMKWPDLGLGSAYRESTQALALLVAGGAAEAASRVLAVQANATGLPWVGVRAEAARWGALALGWMLPLPPGLLPLCAVWSAAAGVAALVFVWHARTAAT